MVDTQCSRYVKLSVLLTTSLEIYNYAINSQKKTFYSSGNSILFSLVTKINSKLALSK